MKLFNIFIPPSQLLASILVVKIVLVYFLLGLADNVFADTSMANFTYRDITYPCCKLSTNLSHCNPAYYPQCDGTTGDWGWYIRDGEWHLKDNQTSYPYYSTGGHYIGEEVGCYPDYFCGIQYIEMYCQDPGTTFWRKQSLTQYYMTPAAWDSVPYHGTGEGMTQADLANMFGSCSPPCEQEYQAKIQECGGAENIKDWDETTCSGECKTCEDKRLEYFVQCENNGGIPYWDYAACKGDCALPETNAGSPQDDC